VLADAAKHAVGLGQIAKPVTAAGGASFARVVSQVAPPLRPFSRHTCAHRSGTSRGARCRPIPQLFTNWRVTPRARAIVAAVTPCSGRWRRRTALASGRWRCPVPAHFGQGSVGRSNIDSQRIAQPRRLERLHRVQRRQAGRERLGGKLVSRGRHAPTAGDALSTPAQ
jgi:hypothetical protein